MDNTIPRRCDTLRRAPEEHCIGEAIWLVETMGADPRLTDAVTLLDQARQRVADFVDGINPESIYAKKSDQ